MKYHLSSLLNFIESELVETTKSWNVAKEEVSAAIPELFRSYTREPLDHSTRSLRILREEIESGLGPVSGQRGTIESVLESRPRTRALEYTFELSIGIEP